MSSIFIDTTNSNTFTGGSVTVGTQSTSVTFTGTGGNYTFGTVNTVLSVNFTSNGNTNFTISDTTLNRQSKFRLPNPGSLVNRQRLTLNNVTSYTVDTEDIDTFNIELIGSSTSLFFINNSTLWVNSDNGPINTTLPRQQLTFSNSTVNLGWYDIGADVFSYPLSSISMCNQCTFNLGMANTDISVILSNMDRIPYMNVLGNVTVIYSSFIHEVIATVASGKTLYFDNCYLSEYTEPASNISENTLFTLNGNTGNVFFTNTTLLPRENQSKNQSPNSILGITGSPSASYSQYDSDSTLLIHHRPGTYDNYDTLYENVSVIKNGTIELDPGNYVFGTSNTDPISFDLRFTTYQATDTNIELYVDGGNVTYSKVRDASGNPVDGNVNWTGYIIGRNNQVGGRSYVFNTIDEFNISGGLVLTANAGNNILNQAATQGTWTGSTFFSYYPNTTTDYSYNLMLENSYIVGSTSSPSAIPLYNGPGTYWYNFYADNTYRPKFYFGHTEDSRFDLSAGTTQYVNFKNADFQKGVDVSLGNDENITCYGTTYRVPSASGSSCIGLTGTGSFTLNFETPSEQNDLYLTNHLNKVFDNQGTVTLRADYNRYHLTAGTWDFNAAGLTTYKSYISTSNTGADDTTGRKGTICLDGQYEFQNIPDIELNLQVYGNSACSGQFSQTIYVWGSHYFVSSYGAYIPLTNAVYNSNPESATPSSLYGTELINLSSMNGTRVFTGDFYFGGQNIFNLPHGKKCIYPFTRVVTDPNVNAAVAIYSTIINLTSQRYSYYISDTAEPLTYLVGSCYLDNAIANDVTVFGNDSTVAVNKAFIIRTRSTSTDQYLTGRFSSLYIQPYSNQKVILGYPQGAVGRSTESGLKVLHVDGGYDYTESIQDYALRIVKVNAGSADVNIENVTFDTPGSVAYFNVLGASKRIDFTSTDNCFNNIGNVAAKHVGYIESYGSNAVLDLGDEVFPDVSYNKFFWPSLESATNTRPLISSQGYVAESWTNDPTYYNNNDSTMYFQNVATGLSKPNTGYELGSWDASANGYDDLYFNVAFGLDNSDTLTATMDQTSNFETYVAGAIYDTDTAGVNTQSYSGTQYRQTIRLRFKDNEANLAQNSGTITTSFTQAGSDLWSTGLGPVPLIYYIDSQVNTNTYTLSTEYTPNGGTNWYEADLTNITVSESATNGSANLRFLYKNGENALKFLYDTSLSFAVDFSFMAVGPDTDLNDYVLNWPALSTASNTLETRPLPFASAWTYKDVSATQYPTNDVVSFRVNNIDDDTYLLASSTSDFTGVYNTLTLDLGDASYNIGTDKYTFTADFYMLTHVLPPAGTGYDSLELDASAFLNGVAVYPTVTVDVSGSGTPNMISADVATPVNVSFSIDNSTLITADSSYTMTLILDDARNASWDGVSPNPNENPILYPATLTINFNIPLYVYLNTEDSRNDQTINETISKGNTNNLYVYLSSKLNSNYTVNFTLTDVDNIVNKDFSVNVLAGDISANGSFIVPQDNKIWGDLALSLTSDVTLANTVNYTYVEATSHHVIIRLGRAIDGCGNESSDTGLGAVSYNLFPNGDGNVRTPVSWFANESTYNFNTGTGSWVAFVPTSKYTSYFVEVEVRSKGFYSNDVNSDLPPRFSIRLADSTDTNLTLGTDYIVNNNVTNVNGTNTSTITDLITDSSANKRLYFHLTNTANLAGDNIYVYVDFSTDDGPSNYDNLNGNSYKIANIDYTGADGNMSSTNFLDSAGIRTNTWRIQPSGDGKFLEFYHDSDPSQYITRLGVDASFYQLQTE